MAQKDSGRRGKRDQPATAAAQAPLAGKRALVTGSGTGIGREIALEFARRGAAVALHYSHSGEGAESAVEEIERIGRRAKAFRADYRNLEQVSLLAAQALEFLGGLDILVNNAGITMNVPFPQVDCKQFDILYQVNVRGPFFLTQAVLPALVDSKGAIINLTLRPRLSGLHRAQRLCGNQGGDRGLDEGACPQRSSRQRNRPGRRGCGELL